MKKYLLGLTALVMAVGMSAFTAPPKPKKKSFDLYWFVVKPGWGLASGFTNSKVDYLTTSPVVPTGVCTVFPWDYKCVIGFEEQDVNTTTNTLFSGSRYPVAIGEKRPTM
jgi:hypothetical protein